MSPPRRLLDREETTIYKNLLSMYAATDQAIGRAIDCLRSQDINLARKVAEEDEKINELQRLIEEECLEAIATQQPVASDLRAITADMHIADELERIADHAADIARIVFSNGKERSQLPEQHMNNIVNMAQSCRDMLKRAMDAVENHDTDLAYLIGEEDEKIDQLEDETVDDLVSYMCKNADIVTRGTHLLWIVHSLERIGDRATNIAERVIFMNTGKILDLNPSKIPEV